MSVNHFDQASRFATKLDEGGFLSWLLGVPTETFVFHGWLDTRGLSFPGKPEHISDTVAHLSNPNQGGLPWALVIEFQSQPDPTMFGRLLEYLAELWLNRKPDPERGSRFELGAAVVNLTGTGATSRTMDWSECGLRTQLRIIERNLERESATDLLAGIESAKWSRCMLPWIPLMSGGDSADTIDWWKRLAESEPDRRRKAEYAGLALVFAEKSGCRDLWDQKLEGWNVEESMVVNSWIAKGEARGEARGISIGEARGEAREAQAAILRLGTKKFGAAPEGTDAMIRFIADHARLTRIIDRIFDAVSWDDLLATP